MAKAELVALTRRQQQIYDLITKKIVDRGYGPTIREIGNQFQIRSPNGVMCHLKALEKKGYITREANMSRAIQLADSPVDQMRKTLKQVIRHWDRGELSAKNKGIGDKLGQLLDDVRSVV